jgi:hypothetical protein
MLGEPVPAGTRLAAERCLVVDRLDLGGDGVVEVVQSVSDGLCKWGGPRFKENRLCL